MIGASILNTEHAELTRSHDTFMQQIKAAWRFVRGDDGQEEKPDNRRQRQEETEEARAN